MAGTRINEMEELRLLKRINELQKRLKNTPSDSEEYEKLSLELKNVQCDYNQLPKYQEEILLKSLDLNEKNDNTQNTKSTNIWDFFFRNRYGLALWMCIVACLLSLFLGVMFYVIVQSDFLDLVIAMFLMWCAPAVVAALLLILTPISEDLSFGFGCGLYYGTLMAYSIISKFTWSPSFAWIGGFIFAALVCYIVYNKLT